MQAIILAAGMGRRLKKLTENQPKCMVTVNGIPMIERMMKQLDHFHLDRIIIVTGHKGEELQSFISSLPLSTPVTYIDNPVYKTTNNIYSLYLAKDQLLKDDTILLESDLIFEQEVLTQIINNPYPNLALVAHFESWMDGTVVLLDEQDNIMKFLTRKDFRFEDIHSYYKTVNIYKFSRNFSTTHYVPFLEAYSKALGNNEYYEQVLKVISLLDDHDLKATRLENGFWYEIDDEQDLDIAESIFTDSQSRLSRLSKRFGGYWRYPGLLDFCYLVNPYFPNSRFMGEIKASFEALTTSYPSGLEVNNLLAAKSLGLDRNHVLTGNGAAELIKPLLHSFKNAVGVLRPSFEEYGACSQNPVYFSVATPDYTYTAQDIMDFYNDMELDALVLVNPDNPTGNYIQRKMSFLLPGTARQGASHSFWMNPLLTSPLRRNHRRSCVRKYWMSIRTWFLLKVFLSPMGFQGCGWGSSPAAIRKLSALSGKSCPFGTSTLWQSIFFRFLKSINQTIRRPWTILKGPEKNYTSPFIPSDS